VRRTANAVLAARTGNAKRRPGVSLGGV